MKRMILLLLVLMLVLSGCTRADAEPTFLEAIEESTDSQEQTEPATEPPAWEGWSVTYEYVLDGLEEYCVITGFDANGSRAWAYQSQRYDFGQLPKSNGIGQYRDRYYFTEDGRVTALDVRTGEILWTNPDFGGYYGHNESALIGGDGTVYLCGYFGPNFFAVDADGKTLKKIDSLDPGYYCAYRLEQGDGVIQVYLSGGPEGDLPSPGHMIPVAIDWAQPHSHTDK